MESESKPIEVFNRRTKSKFSTVIDYQSDSSSDTVNSLEEDFEVEYIKKENRKLCKQITDRFMSFKHSSRMLMNLESNDEVTISPFMENIDKISNNEKKINLNYRKSKEEKTENTELFVMLKTVGKLKNQHRRTKSELDKNMMELRKVEQEKKILAKELNDLQDKALFDKKRKSRGESCRII